MSTVPSPPGQRIATDAFSGYVYQCYLGVERWLGLSDDEVLRAPLGGSPDLRGSRRNLRNLAGRRPDAFRLDLARSLNNLGVCYKNLNQHKRALQVIEECLEIRRELADARPDAFRHQLSNSLWIRCIALRHLGRLEEALADIEEAVEILTPYFLKYPRAFAGKMIGCLRKYSNTAQAAGREMDLELLEPLPADLLQKIQPDTTD